MRRRDGDPRRVGKHAREVSGLGLLGGEIGGVIVAHGDELVLGDRQIFAQIAACCRVPCCARSASGGRQRGKLRLEGFVVVIGVGEPGLLRLKLLCRLPS